MPKPTPRSGQQDNNGRDVADWRAYGSRKIGGLACGNLVVVSPSNPLQDPDTVFRRSRLVLCSERMTLTHRHGGWKSQR